MGVPMPLSFKVTNLPHVVVHVCSPDALEAEAGELSCEFQASLGYAVVKVYV